MADAKEILLKVEAQTKDAVAKIADLTTKVSKLKDEEGNLKKAMDMLRAAGQADSDQYRKLAQELAVNTEAQKAYRKEIGEVSRSVQNMIVSEETHKNTLKGLCAQLSIEKDKLRDIKIEQGKLSPEYKKQEKVVSDLNDKVKEMEQNYGVYTRNVGNYKSALEGFSEKMQKVRLEMVGVIAVVTAGVKAVKGVINAMKESTQQVGDFIAIEVAGWKQAYQELIAMLVSGEGWNNLIGNLKQAYENGKLVAAMLDEIFERENSLKITEAEYSAQIAQDKITARDITKTYQERLDAANDAIDKETKLAELRAQIAKDELEANKLKLMQKTKMTDAEVTAFVNEYNQNRERITQATEYLNKEKELTAQIAMETQVRNYARREELQNELNYLRSVTDEATKAMAKTVAKYNLSNDEIVSNYVNSYTKWAQIYAERENRTARLQTTRAQMLQEIMNGGANDTQYRTKSTGTSESVTTADNGQLQAYADFVNKMRTQTLSAMDAQKEEIRGKYEELLAELKSLVQDGTMSFENANYYRVVIATKMTAELEQVDKDYADKQKKQEEETAKQIAQAKSQELDNALKLAWNNEEAKYQIKKDYLEKELELAEDGTEYKAKLEEQLAQLESTHAQKRIDAVNDYVTQSRNVLSELSDIIGNISDRELDKYETDNDAKKTALEKRLNAGLISQSAYDKQVAKLDAELDKKKAEITRKQAIRQRALSAFEIAQNTATAIMKIWAEVPKMDYGISTIALTATAGALGAAQLASVVSAPLPTARKGGLVQGATHEAGGVLINTENDERIISAKPSKAFPELLNLISYIGKNIPNSGYADRQVAGGSASVDYDTIYKAMHDAVADIKVYTSITELKRAEKNYTRMENLSKL